VADGSITALQKALVARLKGNAGVAALVGARVHDEPPQSPVYPYLRIGDINLAPLRTDGIATASDLLVPVHGHSRATGKVEAARLAEAVIAALDEAHAAITVTGFRLAWIQVETTLVRREADGKSTESLTVFRAVLDVA
jgi:hypothetical protein